MKTGLPSLLVYNIGIVSILLTVQFTDLVKKNQPVNPGQNGTSGGNSGNGGSSGNNGGNGITDRTPVNPNPSDTSVIPGNSIP